MKEKRFEDAMRQLEEIVKSLESGELSLEESLKCFEEGMKLIKFSSQKLEEAEKKVTMLVDSGGKIAQAPFVPAEEKDENGKD